MNDQPSGGSSSFARLPLPAMVAVAVQTIGVVIWLVQLGADVKQVRVDLTELQAKLNYIDEKGTRGAELLRNRITDVLVTNANNEVRARELDAKIVAFERRGDALQAQLEALRNDLKRMEAQEERFLQALDAQYNVLNEHLRSHGGGGMPRR